MNLRANIIIGIALLTSALPAVSFATRVKSDVLPAQKRQVTIANAERLAQRPAVPPLPADLPSPFNPRSFNQPSAAEVAAALAAAQRAAANSGRPAPVPVAAPGDRETLEKLALQITPTGTMQHQGALRLMIGGKLFEVGTRFTATYNNQDYELELIAIDRTTFTLRYRGEETTRPIKPVR